MQVKVILRGSNLYVYSSVPPITLNFEETYRILPGETYRIIPGETYRILPCETYRILPGEEPRVRGQGDQAQSVGQHLILVINKYI